MRFLEVGREPLLKSVYPDQTVYISTAPESLEDEDEGRFSFRLSRLPQILSLVRDPNLDAIFVSRGTERASEGLGALVRLVANRRVLERGVPLARVKGDNVLRWSANVPFILHDPSDSTFITRPLLWMWDRADVVFKRELPMDHWQIFMRTIHPDMPTARFRRIPRFQAMVAKLRPISLGFRPERVSLIPSVPQEKTCDVFFAGMGAFNSSIRDRSMKEIKALMAAGYDIVTPTERLPREEFYLRCAQARLVWSPHGFGHDCHRQYESAAGGSVPVINAAPIEQYAPFKDGANAFIYGPEEGGLTETIKRALARRDELAAMGLAARAHYEKHHSGKARVDHMLASIGITVT